MVVWQAWLGSAERKTHTPSRWSEAWSCCRCLNMHSSLCPHPTLQYLVFFSYTHPAVFFFLMSLIHQKTLEQSNKPSPLLDLFSDAISTFCVCVCVPYCHNSKCVCIYTTNSHLCLLLLLPFFTGPGLWRSLILVICFPMLVSGPTLNWLWRIHSSLLAAPSVPDLSE